MSLCKSFLNFFPSLFVLILVVWAYYSYVIQFCFFILVGAGKRTIYLIIYHILIMLFMWSFLQTVLKRHEPIPNEYHLSSVEHAKLITYSEEEANLILKKLVNLRKLEIYTCAPNTKIRYCKQCMLIKPDRTHHCSTCGKCILKMDHHCPWVYNCVGFSNYKQFLLMLLYSVIWCAFFVATVGEYLADIWKDFQSNLHKLQVGVGFLMAAFTGCLMAILLFYHVGLVCRNETTIEALHDVTFREDNMTFDAGKWYNFREVFGENVCCWLVPTHSGRGNGYEFPAKTSPV